MSPPRLTSEANDIRSERSQISLEMEFFGITLYGPQNYIKDTMRPEYHEPVNKKDAIDVLKSVEEYSTLPKEFERPDIHTIRVIDCYIGRVDGFPYGSMQRFSKMSRKGVVKPIGPCDIFRQPSITSYELGWFYHDQSLNNKQWYKTKPRFPQPASPNTLLLDIARKCDKYASLF